MGPVALLTLTLASLATAADLVTLRDPQARCLDGSRAGYYIQQGGSKTAIILLEGGGVCTHEDDCNARAKTDLGSSKNLAPTTGLDGLGEFMSNDCDVNPDFCNAWKIFLPYCGGDLHAGTRTEATKETFGLFFSGHLIVKALIGQLKTDNSLGSADTLIFSGQSAGGVGVFNNIDYVQSLLPGVAVVGMPIGGYIPIVTPYSGPFHANEEELADRSSWQSQQGLFAGFSDQSCANSSRSADSWKCGVPTLAYDHISSPLLVVESQIDSVIMFQFSDGVDRKIPAAQKWVASYRANATHFAEAVLASEKVPDKKY